MKPPRANTKKLRPKQLYVRVNITLPEGLHKHALDLAKRYHFEGISGLIQNLIREAAFGKAQQSSMILNDSTKSDSDGGRRVEGN